MDAIYGKFKNAADSLRILPILFPIDVSARNVSELQSVENEISILKLIENAENTDVEIDNYDREKTTDIPGKAFPAFFAIRHLNEK